MINIQGELDFVPLTDDLIQQMINIHSQAFAGQMNVKLGESYLFQFFKWFADQPNSITVIARESGKYVQGYVIGAPLGYERIINRDLFWAVTGSILSRPSLWLKQNIQLAVIGRLKALLGVQQMNKKYPNLPLPVISLVGIGVAPQAQNRHIGSQLMQIFEEKSKQKRFMSMRLSVYPENQAARRLYEKSGWVAFANDIPIGQTMIYSKVVFGI